MAEPAREQEDNEVYKSSNRDGKPAQLTSDFDKDDKVAILVETDNKAMYQNFWIEKSKYSGGKWSHQLRGRDGKLHNGGAWFAEGDLHDPK